MKLLIETIGDHFYFDQMTGAQMEAFRPSVIESSNYVNILMASNKIKLISNELKDSATDAEFAEFYREAEDKSLAVDSFLAQFGSKATAEEDEKKEVPKAPKVEVPKAPKATADKA